MLELLAWAVPLNFTKRDTPHFLKWMLSSEIVKKEWLSSVLSLKQMILSISILVISTMKILPLNSARRMLEDTSKSKMVAIISALIVLSPLREEIQEVERESPFYKKQKISSLLVSKSLSSEESILVLTMIQKTRAMI